ncbi:MAG: MBL fold metallo-hydrolase [Alistipes sp.]|nr:MBL fold metallo-hydrolase [Alistipes sp.]
MRLTFLGTGTSQGVPVIGCECDVCKSSDSRDMRLRTSAMVECEGVRLVIDAGPDFRQQMLREGVRHLDAILLTHQHKDHTAGIDDVRAFNFVDFPTIHSMHIFGNEPTIATITKDFDYAFAQNKYRGVPVIELHTICSEHSFRVKNIEIMPIEGRHSDRFTVFGYRFGKLAYLTDFDAISDAELSKLEGVECLVVNALRWTEHSSHFSVGQALDLIRRVAPRRAYLTHMSHEIGLHAEAQLLLPEGVYFAYDGLKIEL